jgi:long-chain acyl-CoA synthetase
VPGKVALVDPDRQVTFAGLATEVAQAAEYLGGQGLAPGERVALLLPGGIDFAVAFLAVLRLGAVAVPLNLKLTPPELERILAVSEAGWLIAGPNLAESLADRLGRTSVQHRVMVGGGEHPWDGGGSFPPCGRYAFPSDDSLAVLIYTSGTTGRPKGAMLTHRNLVHAVLSYVHTLGLTGDDSTLIAVPMFYVTGLVAQFLLFLYLGGTSVIVPRFDAAAVLEQLGRHRTTFFHAVATVYIKLVETGAAAGVRLPHLRLACCGGGPVTPATVAALKAWLPRLDFRPVYGLTETSSPATISPQDASSRSDKPRSAGRPIPVVDCRVVGGDGRPLDEPDAPGELWIRGPVVVAGYWQDPSATAAAFVDGWFRTGDIARLDRDGFVYIVDRKQDIINRGGEKVSSSEVEAALADFPGVREVAVVGVPHPLYGETPEAFVAAEPGCRVDPEELLRFAGRRLARFKVPTRVTFLPELPRSAYGKVLKDELRQREGDRR